MSVEERRMEPGARTRRIALLVRGINVDHIGKDETDESKVDFHAEFLSRGSRGLHNCDRRLGAASLFTKRVLHNNL
jgi:hypothetical protein